MKIGFLFLICFSFFSFKNNTKALDEEYTFSCEDLEEGVYLNEEIFFLNDGFNYSLNNIIVKDNYYLVVGEYLDPISHNTRFYDTYPYLALYQNNTLKWKIKSTHYGHGKFISAKLLDDKIIVVGSFEDNNQVTQIGLFELNYNGDIANHFITKGDYNSTCENLYYFDDTYYIIGETMATNLGYGNVSSNNKILVMAFNEKLKNFNNLYICNDENNKLYKSFYSGNTIALFCKVEGEGYFIAKNTGNIICMVSERLDIDMYKEVNQKENDKIIAIKDEIIFFEYDKDPSKIKATIYGYGLNEIKEINLNLALNVFEIKSFEVNYSINKDKIIIGMTLSNNNKYYDLMTILDDDYQVLYNIEIEKSDFSLLKFCDYLEGSLYSFTDYQNTIYGRKVMYIKMEDKECLFNGDKAEKIICEIDEDVFGIYDQKVQFKYNNIIINTSFKFEVLSKCTIKDKGVYQKGFILEFNGVGFLNGEKIESGIRIEENGNYLLEVIGKDESVYYSFIVKDLSIKEKYLDEKEISIKEMINQKTESNEEINLNLDFNNLETNQNTILFVVLSIVIGFIFGIVIPIERIGKNRA